MNSKSLQYRETASSVVELPALPRKHNFAAIARTVVGWFARSELERAQARFRFKRERAAQAAAKPNIVDSLPLEEKHGLGLYRLMD